MRWVRATFVGWILGVPLVAAFALAGEVLGIGGAQVLIGAGMGAGIGLLQVRVLRTILGSYWPWFWSCTIGLAIPFLAADIAKIFAGEINIAVPVALAGLTVGMWQMLLLRSSLQETGWWLGANLLGWSLAAGTVFLSENALGSDWLRGTWGALAYLGLIVGGGLVIGLITGAALVRMRAVSPATARGVPASAAQGV